MIRSTERLLQRSSEAGIIGREVGAMDCGKIGKLIRDLRIEKKMTQRALADAMNLSDRTISKWERGLGCPDVSLLQTLSALLGVDVGKMLSGDLAPNRADGGNMKRTKFYVCPGCGNVLMATGEAELSCCGRKLSPLEARPQEEGHTISMRQVEDEIYVTIDHPMEKSHFISFIAYVGYDRVLLVKLYPEQGAEARLPQMRGGTLYLHCSEHGLMMKRV